MVLRLKHVTKSFATDEGPQTVLRGVDLELGSGETLALTGESGSGKSTLLHIAGGLEHPDDGQVLVAGQDISQASDTERATLRRGTVGVVFQQFNLIPSLNVGDNLAFQARLANRFDPDWQKELAGRLGLAGLLSRFPEQLSGGQQQRVAIGRTLSPRPALVLADEPTGNLDETTSSQVMALMLQLVAESGSALLMVTHSNALAEQLSRRVHLTEGKVA